MVKRLLIIFISNLLVLLCNGSAIKISRDEYLKQRNALIDKEWKRRIGGNINLTGDEKKVNNTLMTWKLKEIEFGRQKNGTFPPAMHFFKAKRFIDESPVFQLIRKMPKGAALHLHDGSIADIHWIIKNTTYDKQCYMCTDGKSPVLFRFSKKPPSNKGCSCWSLVQEMRNLSGDAAKFDEQLYRNLTMWVDDPDVIYPDGDAAWARFQSLFQSLNGIIFYAPVARAFNYEALQEFYDDNVQYVEMRGLLPQVYELDGSVHDKEWLLQMYQNVSNEFVKDHPNFLGLKVIATSSRTSSTQSDIESAIAETINLRKKFPGFLLGYDVVGQEDRGHSLLSYIDALLKPAQSGVDLPYFFHAGETDWQGTSVDLNLFDAVLLNTSRIGHGFALTKHPGLMKMIRQRSIPIEICPISNQVLRLVQDLRNHPAAALMADGYPLVISSDDPSLWNATGLSYDFYEAFMGLGGTWADLATLKQLAMNSLQYSGLSSGEKRKAITLWKKRWNAFIQKSVEEFSL